MKIFQCLVMLIALAPGAAFAQGPVVAGTGPVVSASFGYSYLDLQATPSTRLGLNGVDLGMTADFVHRLGATIDLGYVRRSNFLGSGRHGDVLSYIGGPVFYPFGGKRLRTYVRGLAGAARVTGAFPLAGGGLGTGFVNKFAWAVGGGTEFRVSPSFGFRVGFDYLHMAYFSETQAIRGEENMRATASLVYRFGAESRR